MPAEAPLEASGGSEDLPSHRTDAVQADGPPVSGAPSVYDEAGRPVPLGDVTTGFEKQHSHHHGPIDKHRILDGR